MSEQQQIKQELAALAPGLPAPSPAMPFSVPAGYFEQLPAAVMDRIRLEENELPAILRTLKEKNRSVAGWPYEIPTGYFDQTQNTILTRQQKTPVISLNKRAFFKYAAAAAVLLMLFGVGRWYQQTKTPDIETDPESWVRKEIEKESSDKIESYVEATLIESSEVSTDDKKEIALLTNDISQEEILYLLSETALLSTTSNESGGQQKILN